VAVDSIGVGRSAWLRVETRGPSAFHMTFKQPRCQYATVDIDDFDAQGLHEGDQRLIIEVGDGAFSRYCEDNPSLMNRVRRGFRHLAARVP
jgi:hypothetical protein